MLYFLRHHAFRGWITLLIGGLLCLLFLPVIQPFTGLSWMLPQVLIILVLVYIVLGWLMNRYGIRLVKNIVAEAAVWERAGRTREADSAYQKAVALFDSFLLSPFAQQKKSAHLIAQMTRFYLARADKNHGSETFVVSYLKSHPEDSEVAENWLPRLKNVEFPTAEYQDIALRIGHAQPDNMVVQETLARFYLSYGRTDFPALQTYRRVLKKDGHAFADIIASLAGIFLDEGRSDEWALEIYLKALQIDKNKTALKKGIAAAAYWIPENADNRKLLMRAKTILAGTDPASLKKMISGFTPPIHSPRKLFEPPARNSLSLFQHISLTLTNAWRLTGNAFSRITIRLSRRIHQVRDSGKSVMMLKRGMLVALAAVILLLLLNTVGYLLKSQPVAVTEKIAEISTTDPFTLQVAAYLKVEHAEKYVAYLKKQKLDAYWKMAEGKSKRWYQVRISHFADKESAVAYGKSLKAKGFIDDFYVANYSRP